MQQRGRCLNRRSRSFSRSRIAIEGAWAFGFSSTHSLDLLRVRMAAVNGTIGFVGWLMADFSWVFFLFFCWFNGFFFVAVGVLRRWSWEGGAEELLDGAFPGSDRRGHDAWLPCCWSRQGRASWGMGNLIEFFFFFIHNAAEIKFRYYLKRSFLIDF